MKKIAIGAPYTTLSAVEQKEYRALDGGKSWVHREAIIDPEIAHGVALVYDKVYEKILAGLEGKAHSEIKEEYRLANSVTFVNQDSKKIDGLREKLGKYAQLALITGGSTGVSVSSYSLETSADLAQTVDANNTLEIAALLNDPKFEGAELIFARMDQDKLLELYDQLTNFTARIKILPFLKNPKIAVKKYISLRAKVMNLKRKYGVEMGLLRGESYYKTEIKLVERAVEENEIGIAHNLVADYLQESLKDVIDKISSDELLASLYSLPMVGKSGNLVKAVIKSTAEVDLLHKISDDCGENSTFKLDKRQKEEIKKSAEAKISALGRPLVLKMANGTNAKFSRSKFVIGLNEQNRFNFEEETEQVERDFVFAMNPKLEYHRDIVQWAEMEYSAILGGGRLDVEYLENGKAKVVLSDKSTDFGHFPVPVIKHFKEQLIEALKAFLNVVELELVIK